MPESLGMIVTFQVAVIDLTDPPVHEPNYFKWVLGIF